MKKLFMLILMILITLSKSILSQSIIDTVGEQLIKKDKIFNGRFPLYTENGKWILSDKPNWFAGFTAGELWYLYEMTGKEEYKVRALKHSDILIQYAALDNTHDLGFIFYNSCVKAYQHTGEIKYRDAAIKAAYMIAKRFNEKGNFIRAWGKLVTDDREGLMIIDTMMNLELLFWAAKETGDYTLYDIAYKHAITCMNENIRKDYSSYHVVEFNPSTGEVIKKKTHQGYGDETTWARGQAWGIYGFAIAYKYTQDERFLNISKKMADYFISKLPADNVPYWDLSLTDSNTLKDASAGAIAASGMFLISELTNLKQDYKKYLDEALQIIKSLKENYIFTKSKRAVEEGILIHTVYHFHKKWGVDESYPAGDFYFIECLKKEYDYNKAEYFIEQTEQRKKYLINSNWFFLNEDINDINKLYQHTVVWERINLPHTWNKTDVLDQVPGYKRGIGWYEKEIFIPENNTDVDYVLHFEGVNIKSEVYVNGKKAGGHIGGYVGFDVDITPFVKKGKYNLIQVKADNSYDPYVVPSQKSDFVIYGGITRNAWLYVLPKTHFVKILIQTPEVSKKYARTSVQLKIKNENVSENYKINLVIKDASGKLVVEKNSKEKLELGENSIQIDLPQLKNPKLWSPSSPYLYTIEANLIDDDKVIDKIDERIGYRWYEFKEHDGFYLNGERLLLRGTHRHEDLAGYGNAIPDSLHRKDIEMIKSMGANFVRLAHYPQAPEIYRACDELGLLVWDENPWCRGGVGPKEWKENTKRIFQEMILQNYNHPSIILWSIGNECDWLPDFPNGDNQDSLKAFAIELHQLAKKLDPYRYTITRKFPAAQDVVDVFSPSIWSGWYSDVYKNYEKAITKARNTYKRLFHAEYGGDSHVGRHTENPINGDGKIILEGGDEPINKIQLNSIANIGDWSESYIVDLFDWYLHVTENLDWFSGSAQWIFRDFVTPLRPENPIPYINQKGLVDRNNKPKDAYYVFKSYWTKEPKFCYIESHTWTERYGKENELKEVNVFSNCDEVELIVNGVSYGKQKKDIKKFPASGLSWKVHFLIGKNLIEAKGYNGTMQYAYDSMTVNYTTKKNGKPEDIILRKERLKNGNYLITAIAVDKNGNRCIDYEGRVYFSALSGGRLIDNLGTPSGSCVIEMANGKASIEFKHIPLQKGVVEVRNQDFKGSYIVIED